MESQTPSGQKPSGPEKPPTKSDTVWISPRLREKLNESEGGGGGGPKDGPSPIIGIVLAILVLGGGAALFWTMRTSAEKEKAAAAEKVRAAAAQAAADSIAAFVHADSLRVAAVAESTAIAHDPKRRAAAAKAAAEAAKAAKAAAKSAATKPAPVAAGKPRPAAPGAPAATPPASGTAATATPPAAPKVVEKGPFGLDVGTFLVEDRAKSEQDKLATATGLAGKVVTRSEDGSDVYHVVLGSFPTRAAAEKKAAALVAAGQVNQAKPVSLAN